MRRYRELVYMVRANWENNADKDNLKAGYKAGCVKERRVAFNSLKRKRNSDDGVSDPVVEVPNDLDLMEEV
jgi:phage head maturation protease